MFSYLRLYYQTLGYTRVLYMCYVYIFLMKVLRKRALEIGMSLTVPKVTSVFRFLPDDFLVECSGQMSSTPRTIF